MVDMALVEKINNEIKEAIRSRNQIRLDTLRMLKSKILAVDARGGLPDSEVLRLFKTYYGNLKEALEQAEAVNRRDIADRLKEELLIIEEFLPKALSVEETRRIVEQAIADSGAKTKRDLGLVMKGIVRINRDVDGKLAKDLASQLLAD
jgi:uncharacterized protein YqeY